MAGNIIRLTRGGDTVTAGQVSIGLDGYPLAYQRADEVRPYSFEWPEYFTRDAETVTITATGTNCTATAVDGTDSTVVTVSAPSLGSGPYVKVNVAITGGETFVMRLNVYGEAVE